MKKGQTFQTGLAVAALSLAVLAGACSVSTAHIKSAKMTTDKEGTQETAVFAADQAFFCIVQLGQRPGRHQSES